MRLSLASKISLAIIGVLVLASLSSVLTIYLTRRFETLQRTIVYDNMGSVKAAEELEIALLEQRGYVSSYILDGGNKAWLEPLDKKRDSFRYWLRAARRSARSDTERDILDQLESVHGLYSRKRAEVVTLFDDGREDEAKRVLLQEVVKLHSDAYQLCERFIDANEQLVTESSAGVRRQVERVTGVVTATLVITLGMGLALLWLFFQGVVFPLRKLAADARTAAGDWSGNAIESRADDLRELGHYMAVLMADVEETRSDLEDSRRQLAHSEKLAAVGKLAASVAHEIRNPLTSIKMWLFSLRRSVGMDSESRQKVDVVSDEIDRLEKIVRSFLEFSRPPQLRMAACDISQILDRPLELLKYRLAEKGIEVKRPDMSNLPKIRGDAEQLMQVFGNLLNNAIDAMTDGGVLRICGQPAMRGHRSMIAIRIADSGPGMPVDVQQRVFEPFFTTKPDGTGLGLSIAASVMARHGGAVSLEKSDSDGSEWTVWIPAHQGVEPGIAADCAGSAI